MNGLMGWMQIASVVIFLGIGIALGVLFLIYLSDSIFRAIGMRMGFYRMFFEWYYKEYRKRNNLR